MVSRSGFLPSLKKRSDMRMPSMMRNLGLIMLTFILAPAGPLHAQSLAIAPPSASVEVGQTVQFSVQATKLSSAGVTWSVAGITGGNSTVGTITSTGLYTAPAALPRQNPVRIIVKSTVNAKTSASVYVHLLSPGPTIGSVSPNPIPVGRFTTTINGSGFQRGAVVLDTYKDLPVKLTTVSVTPTTVRATGYQEPSASASFSVKNPVSVSSNSITVPVACTLKVVKGSGSGAYTAGSVVTITANTPPADKKFLDWTGATVSNPTQASTTLTMPASDTTVTANYATLPKTYTLKVVNGTGSGSYAADSVVTITANAPPTGKKFLEWTGAIVSNSTQASTTLTMPASDTTVTANYATLPTTYTLTVVNGTGSGSYAAGYVVRITANAPPAGKNFLNWTGATVSNPTQASTTLTMPSSNTTVTANYSTPSASIQINSATLPNATQYKSYTAPALTATGGTPPYAWQITTAGDALPEGMTIDVSTGVISSSAVGGQGGYSFQVQVEDSAQATATATFVINVAGDSTYGGCDIFPADSIFHQRVDSLPVDTSPAAPIYSGYQPSHLRVFFGSDAGPDGIPFIRVPWNQPMVTVTFNGYPDESDPGPYPFPANAPIEGTANSPGDKHVLVVQEAGNGQPCKLYETWETVPNGDGTWTASNGAYWDLSSNDLRPLTWTSGDAAGLPIMPLTVNYDEVANGTINHPIRFTVNHMQSNYVWPARHSAGVGSCTNSDGSTSYDTLISQESPPVSCTMTGPAGEIYRLKADVDISVCASNPQATTILEAMKKYGIILADNGLTGGLIGTPDARWDDSDLACLTNFTLSQFEPVNVSSLQVDPNTGQVSSTVSDSLEEQHKGD